MYMNPSRHSMMLYIVNPRFAEGGEDCMWTQRDKKRGSVLMDGGPAWKPSIVLAHEFSLLPHLDPVAPDRQGAEDCFFAQDGFQGEGNPLLGGVTTSCSSVSDMQNRLFKLGFGPIPNFRRAGVLLHISPNELDDDDRSSYMLGCIVAHRCVPASLAMRFLPASTLTLNRC
jgi:hypothetical protein